MTPDELKERFREDIDNYTQDGFDYASQSSFDRMIKNEGWDPDNLTDEQTEKFSRMFTEVLIEELRALADNMEDDLHDRGETE